MSTGYGRIEQTITEFQHDFQRFVEEYQTRLTNQPDGKWRSERATAEKRLKELVYRYAWTAFMQGQIDIEGAYDYDANGAITINRYRNEVLFWLNKHLDRVEQYVSETAIRVAQRDNRRADMEHIQRGTQDSDTPSIHGDEVDRSPRAVADWSLRGVPRVRRPRI